MKISEKLLFVGGFYVIKGILSEKGIISDECNQVLNDTINDAFSGDYSDFYDY